MVLTFVTGNKHKLEEVESLLGDKFTISGKELDLLEIQSLNIEEVSINKAKSAFEKIQKPLIVEDTGLFINCLNGFPGPLVAWIGKSMGYEKLYTLIDSFSDNSAKAVTCITYIDKDGHQTFLGEILGNIVPPKGEYGFGWDVSFYVESIGKTFGEMNIKEKGSVSMRALAVKKLKDFLDQK